MHRAILAILGLALAMLVVLEPARAERRVALVIGNSAYEHTRPLANPENDAKLLASVLAKQGFQVFEHTNLSYKALRRAMQNFASALEADRNDTVGFLFYAGHGVQVAGTNYLIPTDAKIQSEADIPLEGIDTSSIMSALGVAANRLNIIVLDACRDNPYAAKFRSAARGLARIEAPTGSLVAYSTAPGGIAADGDGRNSPYSTALAEFLAEPGLKIEDIFKRVRERVYASTGGKQTPWESSSIFGDFYVVPPDGALQGSTKSFARENVLWAAIKDSDRHEDFEAYLKAYPEGAYVPLAKSRAAALQAVHSPTSESSPRSDVLEGRELIVALQKELTRVGCDPGPIDGKWGERTINAVERFGRSANTQVQSGEPSVETLDALKNHGDPTCPAGTSSGQQPGEDQAKKRCRIVAGVNMGCYAPADEVRLKKLGCGQQRERCDVAKANVRKWVSEGRGVTSNWAGYIWCSCQD